MLASLRLLCVFFLAGGTAQPAETICGQPANIIGFDTSGGFRQTGLVLSEDVKVKMYSLGVGNRDGPPILDLSSPACDLGNCAIHLTGSGLLDLLAGPAGAKLQNEADVFCYFGEGVACGPVTSVRPDEIICTSPDADAGELPAEPSIRPFGLLVLGVGGRPPGTLYAPDGLEINFYDSEARPQPVRLDPPYSDVLVQPEIVRAFGYAPREGRTP